MPLIKDDVLTLYIIEITVPYAMIDFNEVHKDISTWKSDIHRGRSYRR